jgi:lysophospholipase L1-like esterase
VRGSSINIYNVSGAAPRANFTYSIDGGAPVLVTVNIGSTAIQVTNVTGLSDSNHTVVLTWNGAASDPLFIVGVEGLNSTGITVNNLAKSGSRTSQWVSNTTFGPPYNGGTAYPADLVIYSLGVNDANNSVTGDGWLDNVTVHLQAIKAANNGATDIILLHQHIGTFGSVPATTANLFGEYSARIRGLAQNYNAALVNMWTVGRNSWNYNNSIGYWGDPNTVGIPGTDTVHLSDFGHQAISDIITPIVMS